MQHYFLGDQDLNGFVENLMAKCPVNCIIPTNQNHANIQGDFDDLVPWLMAAD